MTDFPAKISSVEHFILAEFTGRNGTAYQPSPTFNELTVDDPPALDTTPTKSGDLTLVDQKSVFADIDHIAKVLDQGSPLFDFFERFHVVPREFALGNIITTVLVDTEVFSGFRRDPHDWDTFVNNVGVGVQLIGIPTLPETVQPLQSINMQLEVTTSAPPIVDDTLDFGFDVPQTLFVPISFVLVQLWNLPPELPMTEEMEFLSDRLRHVDGSDQTLSVRKNPRQFFQFDTIAEDGPERARLDNLLFDWQSRSFGIPVWPETTRLTTPATSGDVNINVLETRYSDFRIGGLILIYEDQTTFDVQEVLSFTTTNIVLKNQMLLSFATGVLVMPLRIGVIVGEVPGGQFLVGASRLRPKFRVTEAGVDLADTSAWPTYDGKVLFDGCNSVRGGVMQEQFQQEILIVDGATGLTVQFSDMDRNRRESTKTWVASTPQGLWEIRQVLHALRGRQVSFYVPTFKEDLEATAALSSGSAILPIVNVGYTQFIRERKPRADIQVVFNDGSPALLRNILSSTEVDADNENLTLDATWPSTFPLSTIERISYVELVRGASDRIRIRHEIGEQVSRVSLPVAGVIE